MRILLLTQYYPPEPVVKFADLARGLRERGHDVQIITGFPCYPAGKTYAGYRQRLYHEGQVEDVLITRVPQIPDHSRSVIRRALYYLSFALSAATIGLWRMRRADVILVYQSALPTALAAWFMSRVKRIPYVLDVADLWPESVAASGMLRNTSLLSMIRTAMKFAYRGAAKINVITEGYRDRLASLGVPHEKMELIHYWVPAVQCDPLPCDVQPDGQFTIVYSGAMGPVQDLCTVIEAASLLRDLPQVRLIMIGDGLEYQSLVDLAGRRHLPNVSFLGRRSPEEVQRLTQTAAALLVHLKPDPLSSLSIPSKTFSYMASGLPILMAVEGEASRLVQKHACGVIAEPSNPQSLADAVRRLVAMPPNERERMADAALHAYRNNYCSEVQIPKVEKLLTNTIHSVGCRRTLYERAGKRIFDVILAVAAMIFVSPLMLTIALAVRWNLGSPVLFAQDRPGRGGRLFKLYKFRTMRDTRDSADRPLRDDERLTPLGRFLRATSLDELPELWNVVRGEMSLVGPRPLLPEYLSLYTPRQARRHDVRPGITGLAQVNGRNAIQWEKKFDYDAQYIDGVSLRLDLHILLKTIVCVLRPHGVNASAHCTMLPFTGSPQE